MAKKKKPEPAQDLIDSLLDNQNENVAARPQAPALPKTALTPVKPSGDDGFESIVFEIDPVKAEPTNSLHLVGDKTQQAQAASGDRRPQAVAMPTAKFAMTVTTAKPSENIHNAATVVQASANTDSALVRFDLPGKTSAPASPDKTLVLPSTDAMKSSAAERPRMESAIQPESRFKVANLSSGGSMPSPTEANLKQTESLRIAQSRIHELENELDRLRRESEQLASAGETLRRRTDELLAKSENLENRLRESSVTSEEEKKIMRDQLSAKERENLALRGKLEEAEMRLEGNFKKIRVRERELEHRLEIVKMEGQTLVATKDDMIMRLKREIDQMKFEIENSKVRSQELYNQYKEKQETARRVVRALRIALTILEGDEDPGLKKAE